MRSVWTYRQITSSRTISRGAMQQQAPDATHVPLFGRPLSLGRPLSDDALDVLYFAYSRCKSTERLHDQSTLERRGTRRTAL
jgi:hypothetical protein